MFPSGHVSRSQALIRGSIASPDVNTAEIHAGLEELILNAGLFSPSHDLDFKEQVVRWGLRPRCAKPERVMQRSAGWNSRVDRRGGATVVEMAVVLPVFLTFMFALIEFGHAFMCNATLTAAAKDAARYGAIDKITTAQTIARAQARINGAFKSAKATFYIKDASSFESASTNTATVSVSSLPNIELSSAAERQLFIVRIEVPYNNVAVMAPFWAKNVTLHGESVMRHE
jgi:Flp pilus assembly protein TadG